MTLAPTDPRHGSVAGASARCKCRACNTAKATYNKRRDRQVGYGRWRPFVDAQPVRDHLKRLSESSLGWERAARLAGVPKATVSAILFGVDGKPPTVRVRPQTADNLLAVRATLETLADRAPVPGIGTVRRLRALVAIGYPLSHLGQQLPVHPDWTGRIATQGMQAVSAEMARATAALYDGLCLALPPDTWVHRRARGMAKQRGWAPPGAWDEGAIDDPNAEPDFGDPEAEIVDDVLVKRVLNGRASFADLNSAEQDELWLGWARYRVEYGHDGPGLAEFSRRYGITEYEASVLRDKAQGPPEPRKAKSAGRSRANQKEAA